MSRDSSRAALRSLARLAAALAVAAACGGCASYSSIAVAPNGTVYVARNGYFILGGAGRAIFACTPSGATLNCVEVANP